MDAIWTLPNGDIVTQRAQYPQNILLIAWLNLWCYMSNNLISIV